MRTVIVAAMLAGGTSGSLVPAFLLVFVAAILFSAGAVIEAVRLVARDLRELRRAIAPGVIVLALLTLTGCTKHYWGEKAGTASTLETFRRDAVTCHQQIGIPVEGRPGYVLVHPNTFRSCMLAKGWRRSEFPADAPPPGWFRGVEEEEIRAVDSIPAQPEPHPLSGQAIPPAR